MFGSKWREARLVRGPYIGTMSKMISDEEAWEAFQRRDRAYDGRVIAGVLTTGIYCMPSCAARHP